MTNPNQNLSPEKPSLGDILQLQATIEALPNEGLRDINETERIAINRYPDGKSHTEGNKISHISLSQRVGNTGRYKTAMNYMVLRDGDETTTRLIKRPPFEIGLGVDPTNVSAIQQEVGRATVALSEYKMAKQMGMFDITKDEVLGLTKTITQAFSSES